jgi:hypothetical protein
MGNKKEVVFKNEIDKFINDKLMGTWNMERRDYYKLEESKPLMFNGYSDRGIMYLGDVDGDHYVDVNLLKDGVVRMTFRHNDERIILMNSAQFETDIETLLNVFLGSINDYMNLIESFEELRRGNIPINMRRNMRLNNILEDESV